MAKYQDFFEEEGFFHVFNHAVGSDDLFRNHDNFRYFLKRYDDYTHTIWDTYAYCLMPNHFHCLVRIKSIDELQKLPKFSGDVHKLVMQQLSNLLNAYAKAYNRRFSRKGALFLDFTKRVAVKDEGYFSTLINYIHQNPVHHGFCQHTEDWLYSSYQACLSERNSKVRRQEVLEWFGDKEAFRQFHQQNLASLQDDLEFL